VRRTLVVLILIVLLAGAWQLYRRQESAPTPVAVAPVPEPVQTIAPPKPAVAPLPEKEPDVRIETGPAGSLDRNVALDLFAQRIVEEEGTGTEEAIAQQQRRKFFKSRDPDETMPARITGYLNAWKAGLDPEAASHFEIVSIECRRWECEILAVENKVQFELQGQFKTPSPPVDIMALDQEPWWKPEHFRMNYFNSETFHDYQLITYVVGYPPHD
jgi:hypothetical protein